MNINNTMKLAKIFDKIIRKRFPHKKKLLKKGKAPVMLLPLKKKNKRVGIARLKMKKPLKKKLKKIKGKRKPAKKMKKKRLKLQENFKNMKTMITALRKKKDRNI